MGWQAEEGLERVYQDRSLTCRDCAEEFTFSAGEQAFYASKSLVNDPQRCPSCRAAAKRARSTDGPREFHAAICGACGGQAVVPFAPAQRSSRVLQHVLRQGPGGDHVGQRGDAGLGVVVLAAPAQGAVRAAIERPVRQRAGCSIPGVP